MKLLFLIVISLLLSYVQAVPLEDNLIESQNINNQTYERYLRLENTLKDIQPQDIIKIILVFSYIHPINQAGGLSNLSSSTPDLPFFKTLFPYVNDSLVITDDDELDKTEFLNKISKAIENKSVVILMYTGHGGSAGEIFFSTYTKTCKNLYVKNAVTRQGSAQSNKNGFHQTWSINSETIRTINKCNVDDYKLHPEDLFKILNNKKVVFFNTACYSGIYNYWINNPLSMLVFGAKADGYATALVPTNNPSNTNSPALNILNAGGDLGNQELKFRLLPERGCILDGIQSDLRNKKNNHDLVLDLTEWTYQLNNRYTKAGQTKKSEYRAVTYSLDDQVLSLPVAIYTENECSDHVLDFFKSQWEDLGALSKKYSETITGESKAKALYINDVMEKMGSGNY